MGDWAQALFEEQAKKSNAAIEVIKKLNIPKVGKNLEIRKMVWGGEGLSRVNSHCPP